jgi:hypothetical protein
MELDSITDGPESSRVGESAIANNTYDDDMIFDNLMYMIPGVTSGARWLIASIIFQAILVTLDFLMHHNRMHDFDCCNMWAVCVSAGFIWLQVPYAIEWLGHKGTDPQWHRGNVLVPWVVFIGVFTQWLVATVSMLGKVMNLDVFKWLHVGNLGFYEVTSFLVCSGTLVVVVALCFALDWAHRNNIGEHYYFADERHDSTVDLSEKFVPVTGSFGMWNVLRYLCTVMQINSSAKAQDFLSKWAKLTVMLQVPFWGFAVVAYSQRKDDDNSLAPTVVFSIGLLCLIYSSQYFLGTLTVRTKKTRRWNREHLWFPSLLAVTMIVVYLVSMSNMFFHSVDEDIWGAVNNLTLRESLYFGWAITLLIVVFFCQLVIAYSHRKIWAEEREQKHIRDPNLVRRENAIFGVTVMKDSLVPTTTTDKPTEHSDSVESESEASEGADREVATDSENEDDHVVVNNVPFADSKAQDLEDDENAQGAPTLGHDSSDDDDDLEVEDAGGHERPPENEDEDDAIVQVQRAPTIDPLDFKPRFRKMTM